MEAWGRCTSVVRLPGPPGDGGPAGMREMRSDVLNRSMRLRKARPAFIARARLFLLLTLLTPLFGALESVAADGMPRIEVQIVPRQVTIEVPVEVVVERFVD